MLLLVSLLPKFAAAKEDLRTLLRYVAQEVPPDDDIPSRTKDEELRDHLSNGLSCGWIRIQVLGIFSACHVVKLFMRKAAYTGRFESGQPRTRVHYTLRGVGNCVEWQIGAP